MPLPFPLIIFSLIKSHEKFPFFQTKLYFDFLQLRKEHSRHEFYLGKYYKDFKVAQHTSDYCEWVSAEKNHWEDYDGGISAYYVLRRSK